MQAAFAGGSSETFYPTSGAIKKGFHPTKKKSKKRGGPGQPPPRAPAPATQGQLPQNIASVNTTTGSSGNSSGENVPFPATAVNSFFENPVGRGLGIGGSNPPLPTKKSESLIEEQKQSKKKREHFLSGQHFLSNAFADMY